MKRKITRHKRRKNTPLENKFKELQRRKRYSAHWDSIRKYVYKRDGYRCRACGARGVKLNAHHILLLRVSQTNDPRNLITLCDKCHREIETKALRLLKNGGHKNDVIRMTFRWLKEKNVQRKQALSSANQQNKKSSDSASSSRN